MRWTIILALFLFACTSSPGGGDTDDQADSGVVIGGDGAVLDGVGTQDTPVGGDKDAAPADQTPACIEGDRVCVSLKEVAECLLGAWKVVTVCPDTHFCSGGTCVKEESCEPGAIQGCYSLDSLKECNAEGTAYEPVKCPAGEMCADGECGEFDCMPGQAICVDGSTKQLCMNDGSGWADPEPCPEGLICVGGKCLSECLSDPKWNNSYIGCEYWVVDLDNYHDPFSGTPPDEAIHGIVLANPGNAMATVTFNSYASDVDFNLLQTTVEPGEVRVVAMPRMDIDGAVISDRSVRVNSNRPIVAYQFNPLDFQDAYSDDSSLLLPAEMLGKEYLILSYPTSPLEAVPIMPMPSQHGYFTVVAVETGETNVSIQVSAIADSPEGEGIFLKPGSVYQFVLQQGDVLNLQGDGSQLKANDLSGSHVIADQKVAVFSGHEEAVVQPPGLPGHPEPDCCCAEHLEEQLFPLETWANTYVCAKAAPRGGVDDRDLWRIQAGKGGTTISTDPPIEGLDGIALSKKGDWVEAYTDESFVVDGTGPLQVAQYLVSQGCTDQYTGDPALIMAVSSTQYRNNYVIAVPKDYQYDYVGVVKPAAGSVNLDGAVLPQGEFAPIADGTFEVGYFEVQDGKHTLDGDAPFGLYQYGFSGPASYGHPGGLNLIKQ